MINFYVDFFYFVKFIENITEVNIILIISYFKIKDV